MYSNLHFSHMKLKEKNNKKAFTIIELVITTIIIATLYTLVITFGRTTLDKSTNQTDCYENTEEIMKDIENINVSYNETSNNYTFTIPSIKDGLELLTEPYAVEIDYLKNSSSTEYSICTSNLTCKNATGSIVACIGNTSAEVPGCAQEKASWLYLTLSGCETYTYRQIPARVV